jgi:hypothetical protein
MRNCANDNARILDPDDAQDRKDEVRHLSVEREAREWRVRPDLVERAKKATLACRRATDEISHLSRIKRATPTREVPLAERSTINSVPSRARRGVWMSIRPP